MQNPGKFLPGFLLCLIKIKFYLGITTIIIAAIAIKTEYRYNDFTLNLSFQKNAQDKIGKTKSIANMGSHKNSNMAPIIAES